MAINQAIVADIRRMAVAYQSMVAAADALEAIGSLEQVTAEATAARDLATLQRDTVLVQLEDANTSLLDARTQAALVLKEAKDQADALLTDSTDKSKAVVADALAQAELDAQAHTSEVLGPVQAQLAQLQTQHDALVAHAETAGAFCNGLDADIAAKQKQLDALNAALESLKAKLA